MKICFLEAIGDPFFIHTKLEFLPNIFGPTLLFGIVGAVVQ